MNNENSVKWTLARKLYLAIGIVICGVAIVLMTYPR